MQFFNKDLLMITLSPSKIFSLIVQYFTKPETAKAVNSVRLDLCFLNVPIKMQN